MKNEIHASTIRQEVETRLYALMIEHGDLFEKIRRFHERSLLLLHIHKDLVVEDIDRRGVMPPTRVDLGRLLEAAKSEISVAEPFEERLRKITQEMQELRMLQNSEYRNRA